MRVPKDRSCTDFILFLWYHLASLEQFLLNCDVCGNFFGFIWFLYVESESKDINITKQLIPFTSPKLQYVETAMAANWCIPGKCFGVIFPLIGCWCCVPWWSTKVIKIAPSIPSLLMFVQQGLNSTALLKYTSLRLMKYLPSARFFQCWFFSLLFFFPLYKLSLDVNKVSESLSKMCFL